MSEYRAVLIDKGKPAPDRPIQTISNSLSDIEDWIMNTLARTGLPSPAQNAIDPSPQAFVDVYRIREDFVAMYDVAKAKDMAAKKRGSV